MASALRELQREWEDVLQELRVAQTGTQVMSGFLLAVAFQPRFQELAPAQLALYVVLVSMATLATVTALLPGLAHRLLTRGRLTERLLELGSRILLVNTVLVLTVTLGVFVFIVTFVL